MDKVYAAGINIEDYWKLSPKGGGFKSLADVMSFVFPKILIIGGVIFFILMILAGVGVISGAGGDDPHGQEQAKNFLTYSVIGLLIMFGSYWLLQIISSLTGGSLKDLGF